MDNKQQTSNEASETARLAADILYDLGVLFTTIMKASDKRTPAHDLAAIGQNLAQDWSNQFDVQREDLEAQS